MEQDRIQQFVDSAVPVVTQYGLSILGAIAILIIGRIAAGIAGRIAARALERGKVDSTVAAFLVNLVRIAVIAFAVIAALSRFGIETTSFVAVLGAAGFAIGFALQGSLSNFAAGVMLLVFRPIRVGDLIEAAGYVGEVADIGLFVTQMNTLDNQRILIPNAKLTGDVLNNMSANGTRRVDLVIGVSYMDDISLAKKVLRGVVSENEKVLADPAPDVAVYELADSSVNLVVRPWCRSEDYWDVWFEVTEASKAQLEAAGITIPFPQRDVHLHQAASGQ